MSIIRIGGESHEFLAITIRGRNRPDSDDFWDGNWIGVDVEVAAGGFRGAVSGDLRAEELAAFHRELTPLVESLVGVASFCCLEDWLSMTITGDARGHVKLACEVRDQLGEGNTLVFRLALDQSDLKPMVDQIGLVISRFPVVGRPEV